MAGSEAEERIRAKVEASLRRSVPGARIIHELVIGAVRFDLAAVSSDALVLAEIKSERDVLKRLPRQAEAGLLVTKDVRVFVAERHAKAALLARSFLVKDSDGRYLRNDAHVPALEGCTIGVERGDAFEVIALPTWAEQDRLLQPSYLFNVMWAEEMRQALSLRGLGPCTRLTMRKMTTLAVEHLSGREIRRAVCAALMQRRFPRADAVAQVAA